MSAHITSIKHFTSCFSQCNKVSQINRNYQDWKERSKLYFSSDVMTICTGNPVEFTKRATGTSKRV